MPDPSRLVRTVARAADLCRATPGRTGHVVDLGGATDVLVAGDLHGHLANFQKVFQLAALDANPGRHLVLQELVHGKNLYPGGGEKSHQLVDLFCALKCQYPGRVHYLLGNHELSQWQNRAIAKDGQELNSLFYFGVEHTYGESAPAVYDAYLRLFGELPAALRTPEGVFISHSLPAANRMDQFRYERLLADDWEPTDLSPPGSLFLISWGRDVGENNAANFLELVGAELLVTGHVVCDNGYDTPNPRQLIVDCHDTPAACCLIPTGRPLALADLVDGVTVL